MHTDPNNDEIGEENQSLLIAAQLAYFCARLRHAQAGTAADNDDDSNSR
jgi:hypothetical protein